MYTEKDIAPPQAIIMVYCASCGEAIEDMTGLCSSDCEDDSTVIRNRKPGRIITVKYVRESAALRQQPERVE